MLIDVRLSDTQVVGVIVAIWQRIGFVGADGACPHSAYVAGYLFRSSTRPPSPNHVHRVAPARPFFVVMTITPLAACVPYNVAAEGPFTISMSSISSGDIVLRKLRFVPPKPALTVPAAMRTPSTTKIGSLLRLSEFAPRMRNTGAAPVMFGAWTITPGAFATIRSARFAI